jgi:UDPglucose 6-dehydrogenase
MSLHRKSITVAGAAGYVGLITALELARLGRTVWCVDIAADKIEKLKRGEPPFVESGLPELLQKMIDAERLRFATSYEDAIPDSGFVFIALPTPSPATSDAAYDMTAINRCLEDMVRCGLGREHAIVMKSTVPCGTGSEVTEMLRAWGVKVPYISCPEFLREGTALSDADEPDRIVIGDSGQPEGAILAEIFDGLGENGEDVAEGIKYKTLRRTRVQSAELVKLASNGWLATQIGVINEVANLSDSVRADVVEVAGLMERPEIPRDFLKAGIGFAGPCFPKDVHGLRGVAIDAGVPFQLLDTVLEANRQQPLRAVDKARRALGTLDGKTVAVLGASFKGGTSDTRDSMAVTLIVELVRAGAEAVVFDPEAKEFEAKERKRLPDRGWRFAADVDDCLRAAELAIVATDWPDFKEIAWGTHSTRMRHVVDGRNWLNAQAVTDAGVDYDGIGRRVLGREASTRLRGSDLDEFANLAALALLAIKDCFMAEMAAISERVGADWAEVAEGIALDRRIGRERLLEWNFEQDELDAALEAFLARAAKGRCRCEVAARALETRASLRTR